MLLLARAPQRCRHRRRCHRGLDRTLACCAPSPLASPTPVLLLAGDPQRSRRRPAAGAAAWPVARRRAPPAGLSAGCCGTLGSGSVPPSAANSMLLASHAARRALAAAAVRHGRPQVGCPGSGCVRDTRCSPATAADVRCTAGHAAKPRTALQGCGGGHRPLWQAGGDDSTTPPRRQHSCPPGC